MNVKTLPNTFQVKCKCQTCGNNIAFEVCHAGELVPCPHCGLETRLFVPAGPRPEVPQESVAHKFIGFFMLLGIFMLVALIIGWIIGAGFQISSGRGGLPPIWFGIFLALAAGFTLVVYLAPALIAHGRNKRNAFAILILTLFAGWSLIGWIVALVWACTADAPAAKEA